ncbi:MAG: zinc metalloprotease HtpX [Nanoarchaeota archaeon]
MLSNYLKTVLLLGILTGLCLWVGSFWGSSGLTFAFIIVLLMNFVSYFWSDKIVLMMYQAKPLKIQEYPWLHSLVKDLCKKAELPLPKLYLIPSEQPNAFATGRNPNHAAVACTEGILKLLSREELRGVLGHELSHVKNRDILICTIAATIAGVISYIGSMVRWGGMMGGGNREDKGGLLELVVLGILTPILAVLLQLAISRSREYLADESGAKLLKDGKHLASALLKLESGTRQVPMRMGNQATSALFIANPFSGRSILGWLSTHPPIPERVSRLKKMKFS